MPELNRSEKRQATRNAAEQFHNFAKERFFDVSPLVVNKTVDKFDFSYRFGGVKMQFMMFREGR